MKPTVLGYDASPASEQTLERAVELAGSIGADAIVGMSSRDIVARNFGGVSDDVAHNVHCGVLLMH